MGKYNWDLEKIKEFVKESINLTEVLNKLKIPRQGNNSKTLKNILNINNIDYSHFTGRSRTYSTNYIKASEYLDNPNKRIRASKLKEKLLKEKIIENKCFICGINEWKGKSLVLQLHHIDGNPDNNSLDNLQLLCPNCHSQTENYCGNANNNPVKYYCKICGKEITKGSTYCSVCASERNRKVKRPTLDQLISDFKELKTFVSIGNKYGVTGNTIKKWFSLYNLPKKYQEISDYIKSNFNKD